MIELKNIGTITIGDSVKYPDTKTLLFTFNNIEEFFPITNKELTIQDITLSRKTEAHITLIGNETGKQIKEFCSESTYEETFNNIVKDIQTLIGKTTIKLTNDFTFIKRTKDNETRYSLIRDIKTTFNKKAYQIISKHTNLHFPNPHPHITLYKQTENEGIGVNSIEEYELYKVIKVNDIHIFF